MDEPATSFEVFSLAVRVLEVAHCAADVAAGAVAARNALVGLDERTLRRVGAAIAVCALNCQDSEDRSAWLARLDIERLLAVDI